VVLSLQIDVSVNDPQALSWEEKYTSSLTSTQHNIQRTVTNNALYHTLNINIMCVTVQKIFYKSFLVRHVNECSVILTSAQLHLLYKSHTSCYIVCEKQIYNHILPAIYCSMQKAKQKKYVRIHNTQRLGKKYTDDLLRPMRFWSVHMMDTLLSHEATGEDLWIMLTLTGHMIMTTWQM